MDSSICCALSLPNRQTLVINGISLSDSQHLKLSTYTFNITTSVINLIATDKIQINFPPEYYGSIKLGSNSTICTGVSIIGLNNTTGIKVPIGCNV